jgi:hypothetical protein
MTERETDEAMPVAPAPYEESPSSTGVVDGDGTEPTEASPAEQVTG